MAQLEQYIWENLPNDSARLRWIEQGRPIGVATQDIAEGETFTLSLDSILIHAVLDALLDNPLPG